MAHAACAIWTLRGSFNADFAAALSAEPAALLPGAASVLPRALAAAGWSRPSLARSSSATRSAESLRASLPQVGQWTRPTLAKSSRR